MTVILATILCLWIYQRILTPLTNLSFFTKKVERTANYKLRSENHGNDEISQLSHDINNMLNTIDNEMETNNVHTIKLIEQQNSMEKLANYDTLTGLPNRMFFMNVLGIELSK